LLIASNDGRCFLEETCVAANLAQGLSHAKI
jgi:hypothetical protein